jgi:hypothetical protein
VFGAQHIPGDVLWLLHFSKAILSTYLLKIALLLSPKFSIGDHFGHL